MGVAFEVLLHVITGLYTEDPGGGGGTDVLVYTYILYHLVFVDNSVSELDIRYIYMTLFGEFLHCLGFPVHLPLYEGRYSAPGRMMSPHYTSILV